MDNNSYYKENTKKFSSFSQNYQDVFALMCSKFSNSGYFIDIGCSTPDNISNVLLLLNNGWSGIGFDLIPNVKTRWKAHHKMEVESVDVLKDWSLIEDKINKLPKLIDYLSLDLDGYPAQYAIEKLDLDNRKFRCMTIEHDAYRFGDIYKNAQREVLLNKGYEIVITTAAEDWYIMPELIDEKYLNTLREIPEHMICDSNIHDIREYIKFYGTHEGPYR